LNGDRKCTQHELGHVSFEVDACVETIYSKKISPSLIGVLLEGEIQDSILGWDKATLLQFLEMFEASLLQI
jgi:hypothetical protein